jgi:hypothetical protein
MPLQLSFYFPSDENNFFYWPDTLVVIWFLIDIFIHIHSGYIYKGMLIMDKKKIVINYLKFWLFFDIVCSFPYEWIISSNEAKSSYNVSHLYK